MNIYRHTLWFFILNLLMAAAVAAPVGSGFSYQGELKVAGVPANTAFDFEFALFNVTTGGAPLDTLTREDLLVNAGLFTTELDYTDVPFSAAEQYWLEVRVRDGASAGGYQQLLPRHKLTPTPYAVNARTVQAGGVNQNSIAVGAVGNAQLQTSAVGTTQLGNLAVTEAKIADATITDAKIADATITAAKLAFAAGDVTAVTAGSGLIGGGGMGDLDLAVDTNAIQTRVTGNCPIGAYFRGITADGTVMCESVLAFLGITLRTVIDTLPTPLGEFANFTAIAIGSDGLPVISYFDSSGALKVAKCGNTACTGVATITTIANPANIEGFYTSIAIGSDGLPVISYLDNNLGALKVGKCVNADCTGSATITTIDDPGNSVGYYNAIAIGSDGLPVIAYQDLTARTLKVAKCLNAACTGAATITTVDDPANFVGFYTAIAIGSDGMPVISYLDSTAGALKAAKCLNAACTGAATISTVDDPVVNLVGFYTALAVGSDGLPVISYQDLSASTLKVAKCLNAACSGATTISTVDDPVNLVGSFTAIAVGSDGLPVIGYLDFSANSLKVAKCRNAACVGVATITTVDDPANGVGYYNAIAIGSDGLPVISYFDTTNISLKVAKCGTPSCQ
ncbi:MAG: hypothetical protein SGI99_14620 [Pseudomonadota bacterium]|nr:hypothetical protein [Pseudomonadota bacterium]